MISSEPDIKVIFYEALGKPSGPELSAYLDETCQGDSALRSRLEALLLAYSEAGSFLELPASPPTVTGASSELAEHPGTIIGPYKLLEQIGEGGMGVVYMAEQTQPVRRKVALKIIKPGMDTKQVIARFEAERQALALMDHPNIAKVLDAGTTPPASPSSEGGAWGGGRPYFVMELVKGIPITDYCDKARLSIPERLDLFVLVCRAVQHAHQKGIIHRDLKPSNVLVTLIDGAAVPKVIDFGVAKATGGQLTDRTLFTGFAQLIGTPLYMSPEQAGLSGVDVDTRSDIYALGVLLYELLTGTTPIDRDTICKAAYDEVRRIIREQEPPTPSTRLSTLAATLSTVSANRQADSRKLSHAVRGELDWIVMKALEKDRTRRYETANDLAADVMRHQTDQPVEACPPSKRYRFAKFVRRNRAVLTTAAMVAVALIAGTMVSARQAVRATTAERDTEAALATARHQRDLATQQRNLAGAKTREATEKAESLEWQLYISRVNRAQNEWTANNVAEAEHLLDSCPTAMRGWEWHYVKRLCHLDLLTYRGHTNGVLSVAFSPDGTRVVSGSGGRHPAGELAVWDAATGREAFVNRELKGIHCVAFRPDGRAVASGNTHGDVTLWDAGTGQEIFTREGSGQPALSVAFSPDGRQLAVGFGTDRSGSSGGHCELWNAATGAEIWSLPGFTGGVQGLAISPDGTRLALTGTQVVELWDLGTRQRVRLLRGHADLVDEVAFSPDSRRLASSSRDDTVRIWDVGTGDSLLVLHWPSGEIFDVAFSPDGRSVAAASEDRSIKLWDAASGAELATFRSHTSSVFGMAFSPDGTRLASAGDDATVKIWDVRTSHPVSYRIETPDVRNAGVTSVALSPDGTCLAMADWHAPSVNLWDIATSARMLTVAARVRSGSSVVAFSPDGRSLATAIDLSDVKLRDARTGREIYTLRGHKGSVGVVAFSPDGARLASAGEDGTVRLWETATGNEAVVLSGPEFGVIGVSFSRDGRRLAAASDRGEVSVWDPATGSEVFARRTKKRINAVALSPDGRQVAWTTDSYRPASARLAPEGYASGEVKVSDVDTGREIQTLRGHTASVRAVAFSPDGTRLASASDDRTIKFWDVATGAEVLTLRGHTARVFCLAFSGDGRLLASGSHDATARIWNATPVPAERAKAEGVEAKRNATVPDANTAADANYRKALAGRYGQLAFLFIGSPDHRPEDTARAIELAQKAVDIEPGNPQRWNMLGVICYRAGKWKEAIAAHEKALALLEPPDKNSSRDSLQKEQPTAASKALIAVVSRGLAWDFATCPDPQLRNVPRAIELAQRAVDLVPDRALYWTTLGVAYYRAEKWNEAIGFLKKSAELSKGGDGMDFFFLAMAYQQLGENDEARAQYDRAVAWIKKNQPEGDKWQRVGDETRALLGVPLSQDEATQGTDPEAEIPTR